MKICFVLPKSSNEAIGGYKIVYEYANRLIKNGHIVSILYLNTNYLKAYHIPRVIKKFYFDVINRKSPKWFTLNKDIEQVSDYSRKKVERLINEYDVAVATAVRTAPYVDKNFKTINKIYLIQGRETWTWGGEFVDKTYRLGMKNIVVSQWLKEIVDEISQKESTLIKNPIDVTQYKENIPYEKRPIHSLSVLYNPNPVKGFDNAFKVIVKLKDKYPDLTVKSFGAYPKPDFFPEWIDYIQNASQQQTIDIYNQTQVYICSSIDEGYGLTGLEAMACGCALSSTNYSAVFEYAVDKYNCLLSDVGDTNAQVNNIIELFEDDNLRRKICSGARDTVKDFSWDIALDKFMKVMGNVSYEN